jgi:UDP-glucose 4-epimerase
MWRTRSVTTPVCLVEGDIRDVGLVRELSTGKDLVFHLAAIRITQCAEEPRLANEVLVDGTFNVLEAAAAAGVKKVVASSSASVYGLAEQFPTTERHHPYNNDTFYGAAKAFNEGCCAASTRCPGWTTWRCATSTCTAPDGHPRPVHRGADPVDGAHRGRHAAADLGDGMQTMDFVHVADIARANILAAEAPVTDDVFNIACGVETSLNDLAHALPEGDEERPSAAGVRARPRSV